MSSSFLTTFFTFIFATIIGGVFAHRLQHRNWIRQQYLSNQEKLIAELKSIFVDLDSLLSRRLYRTRRVLYALRRNPAETLKKSIEAYDTVISEWNEKRNSFQIRLVRVISTRLARDFEHDLSRRFVAIGGQLERLSRAQFNGSLPANFRETLTDLEHQLDMLSRSVYEFLRAIYKKLQHEQNELFYVDRFNRIPEFGTDVDNISFWYLLKSLFVPPPISLKEP